MHFHPILLVQAEDIEIAKIIARDFCDCECGERSFFDYGGIVPDEKTEWNKPFIEVKNKLPADNHIEEAERYLKGATELLEKKYYCNAGYYFMKAGELFSQCFSINYPVFNIQTNDYSRDCGEGWFAIEADLHF